jgi:hypothetical protein
MIKIELIDDGIFKEIDRLSEGLSLEDRMRFEAILVRQFQATQAAVHVITRSLKTSGKFNSEGDSNSWKGEITYGGRSKGIHNPVDYAEYERERGGAHDFLRPAQAMEAAYEAAIREFLEG